MPKDQNEIHNSVWKDSRRAPGVNNSGSHKKHLNALSSDGSFLYYALNEHAIISMTDVKGNILSVNDKFVEISGYSREELIGQNHRMLKSDEHTKTFYQEMWGKIASGISWTGDIKNLKKNGEPYWVKATIVPNMNELGKPIQYLSIRTDITKTKAVEAWKHQQLAFDSVHNEIYMFWPDTLKFFYVNKAARKKSRITEDILDCTPMDISQNLLTEKDFRDRLKPLTDGKKGHITYSEERLAENGEQTSFEITIQLIRSEGENPHFVAIIRDVTERMQAQEELRNAKERFSDFAESGSDWFWELDEDFRFTNVRAFFDDSLVEERLLQNLGRTRWDVVGANPDADDHWRKHVEDLKSHHAFRGFRYSVRDSQGKVRNFSASGKPFFTKDGVFAGYRGTSVDLTELALSEAVNDRFLDAINHLSEGIALWDEDEKLLFCNEFLRKTAGPLGKTIRIGMAFEQWLNQHVRQGLIPEAKGQESEWIDKRLSEFRNPSGSKEVFRNGRWHSLSFTKLPDGCTMMAHFDIHDLKMNEYRFEAATTVAGVGVWESSTDHGSSIWSDSCYNLLGLSPGLVEPTMKNFLNLVHHEDRGYVKGIIDNSMTNPTEFNFECRIQKANGAIIWARAAGKIMDISGTERWFGSLVDIDYQKRADIVKSEFITTMNHELRTPLTSIIGALDLIRSGVLGEINPKMSKLLTMGKKNADQLLTIVNGTLDIEKLESGHFTFSLEPVSAHEILSNAAQNNALYAKQNGVELKLASLKQSFDVLVDHRRIQQVFSNLISNAAKFSPDGSSVEISAEIDADFGVFRVKDRGRGISEEFRPKLFDRFTQEDSSDTRRAGGTGLGLAIVKSLIESQGGTINFESEMGVETTFSFSLPLAD